MGNSPQPREQGRPSDLVQLSRSLDSYTDWTSKQWETFKYFISPTFVPRDEDVAMLILYAVNTGLCPFRKQIYLIYRQGKPSIQVGIDGFYKIAQETGNFGGFTETQWCGMDGVWRESWDSEVSGKPTSCRVGIRRLDHPAPTFVTVKFKAYYPQDAKCRFLWDKMPERMIEKCAEALGLRKLFQQLSGLYTDAEMDQAGPPDEIKVQPQANSRTDSGHSSQSQAQGTQKSTSQNQRDWKKEAYRDVVAVAKEKWKGLTLEQINGLIRRFAEKRKLLNKDPKTGRASIQASSVSQVRNLAKVLREWEPPKEDDIEEAEVAPRDVNPDVILDSIEKLEAYLSGIPMPDGREQWATQTMAQAIAGAPKDFPGIALREVYGPVGDNGYPMYHRWNDHQLFRWERRLSKLAEQAAAL